MHTFSGSGLYFLEWTWYSSHIITHATFLDILIVGFASNQHVFKMLLRAKAKTFWKIPESKDVRGVID